MHEERKDPVITEMIELVREVDIRIAAENKRKSRPQRSKVRRGRFRKALRRLLK